MKQEHAPPFRKLTPVPPDRVAIQDPYWGPRMELNATDAIFYQWTKIEETGRMDNFRIIAGIKNGFRKGFFYDDSDVHKWAEAASLILGQDHPSELEELLKEYVSVITKCMESDGYVFTYNQFHFPDMRWVNLQIEHELYTLGHLIEAGISHFETTGSKELLAPARRSADLLVRVFSNAPKEMTPGHEEVELALIRLYRITGRESYLKLAEQFIDNRGRARFFGWQLVRQFQSQKRRSLLIQDDESYPGSEKKDSGFDLEANRLDTEPPFLQLRAAFQFLTGRYFQQHRPIRRQKVPRGHSVRWAYYVAGAALLFQERGDPALLSTLEQAWDHMVTRKMYVTGGIGSLPVVEGFGRDYELDNVFSYSETCAAIGSILFSWEMLLATGNARYAELMEWQIYNASAVGIGLDGKSYLYRNPLQSDGGLTRRPWFDTACCPSNISRLWARLRGYVCTTENSSIHIHQYIGGTLELDLENGNRVGLTLTSELPWSGKAAVKITSETPVDFTLHLRVPGWSSDVRISVNGEEQTVSPPEMDRAVTASGFSPYEGYYLPVTRTWKKGDILTAEFTMEPRVHRSHRRVKNNRGMVALSRGPLVYCLESVDNPHVPLETARLNLEKPLREIYREDLFTGIWILQGEDASGTPLVFIPYPCWANREESSLRVYVMEKESRK